MSLHSDRKKLPLFPAGEFRVRSPTMIDLLLLLQSRPKPDSNGMYKCRKCNSMLHEAAHLCYDCQEEKYQFPLFLLKRYGWIIVAGIIYLIVAKLTGIIRTFQGERFKERFKGQTFRLCF